jgi:hypothetical protein
MGLVLRFPLERRRALRQDSGMPDVTGQILVLPVIRVERHDLPPPPVLTVDPPRKGGDGSKRRRRSA